MKLDLVYNPASGHFQSEALECLVGAFAARGFAVTSIATRPDRIALSGDADLVCVQGGDGTLQQVALAMGESVEHIPICIAPSGTINLIARELGYARDPLRFADQVAGAFAAGRLVRSPMFSFAGMPVVACMSIGPDSAAVAHVSLGLKERIGRYAYVAAALDLWREWPRHPMGVRALLADGTMLETEAEAVFIARSRLYAGPFRLAPRAAIDSETFELVLMKRSTRLGSIGFAAAVMAGAPLESLGFATIHSVRRADLGDCRLPVQIDGEHIAACSGTIAPSGLAMNFCV